MLGKDGKWWDDLVLGLGTSLLVWYGVLGAVPNDFGLWSPQSLIVLVVMLALGIVAARLFPRVVRWMLGRRD